MKHYGIASGVVPLFLIAAALFASSRAAGTAPAIAAQPREWAGLHACRPEELVGLRVDEGEVGAHRRFELPVSHYPFGNSPPDRAWSLQAELRVEPDGRVSCYRLRAGFMQDAKLDPSRRQLLASMANWRYEAFLQDGRPVVAIVPELLREQEDPGSHVELPDVPLADVAITLSRSGCFGTCPSYQLELRGDGRAVYVGKGYVDVEGRHEYTISADDFARLVESIRHEDLWSLRGEYQAQITDNATTTLQLKFGGQHHTIVDYVGAMDGMPGGVSRIEEEIDRVGRADEWKQLSMLAIETLLREGFDFRSPKAGEILARAVGNDGASRPGVIERLMALGAPIDQHPDLGMGLASDSTLTSALRAGRAELVDPLVARGALDVDGKRSQAKVDAAFRAAIQGGRLASVQAVWERHGSAKTPALFYDEPIPDDKLHRSHRTSVVLLLSRPYAPERPWDALAIAKWMRAQGANLNSKAANGDTLLHRAAEGGDAGFVRFLLSAGLDPNARGDFGLTALGSTDDEDVMLALLDGGADPHANDHTLGTRTLREDATQNQWSRVLAWLDAHPRTGSP